MATVHMDAVPERCRGAATPNTRPAWSRADRARRRAGELGPGDGASRHASTDADTTEFRAAGPRSRRASPEPSAVEPGVAGAGCRRFPAASGRGGFRDRPAVRGGQEGIRTAGRGGFRGPANVRGEREGIRAGRRGGVADRAAVGGAWAGARAGRRLHGDRGRAPGATAVAAWRAARSGCCASVRTIGGTGVRTIGGAGVRSNGGARGRGGADRAPVRGGDGDTSDRAAVPCGGRRAGDRAGFGGVADGDGGVRGVGRRRDGARGRGSAATGEPAPTGAAVGLQGSEPTVNGGFTSS
jgi:hypothetical protein